MPDTAVEPNTSDFRSWSAGPCTGFCVSAPTHHIEEDMILRIDLRPDGNHAHVGRHHRFQIGEKPRPTDALAVQQRLMNWLRSSTSALPAFSRSRLELGCCCVSM